jgi:hypothetical protein
VRLAEFQQGKCFPHLPRPLQYQGILCGLFFHWTSESMIFRCIVFPVI